jgi:regulator of replication initiation timing
MGTSGNRLPRQGGGILQMSELKEHRFIGTDELFHDANAGALYYEKSEADNVIAGLKARTAELEALNHDLCERVTENDEIRLHWEEIEQTRAENERMKARIAELEEERRWRKFPDEKPEEWDTVIVRFGDGFYDLAVYMSNGQGWDIGDGRYHKSEEVSHWMPMPSAPREEK